MKKNKTLIIFIIISLISLFYIYTDINDRAEKVVVGYSKSVEKELFENLDDDEINSLIDSITDSLIYRKSAKEKNQEIVIEKFREKGLVENKEKEEFIKNNITLEIN